MASVKTATDRLPSLPQALIPVLDATRADEADFQSLARAILQDAGLSSRILQVANSPYYYRGSTCRTIDRALFSLGLDTVRSLALTAAIQQLFGSFGTLHRHYLRTIWRRALSTATMARVLATLTRHPRPDEAYLAGLLIDIGRLIRLSEDPNRYGPMLETAADDLELTEAERSTYGTHYGELGAECLEAWGLGRFIADAVRHHLDPPDRVRDAHHLVKLVNLAHTLGQARAGEPEQPVSGEEEQALAAAHTLFDLNEGLTRELRARITEEVRRIAGSLGIEFDTADSQGEGEDGEDHPDQVAARALGSRVRDLTELERISGELARAPDRKGRYAAAQRALYLTLGISQSLLFLLDDDRQTLLAWADDDETPDFTLPLQPERSLVTNTFLEWQPQHHQRQDADTMPVVDQQIFRLCDAEWLSTFPLLGEGREPNGVLVLGLTDAQFEALQPRSDFIRSLAHEIGRALAQAEPAANPDEGTEQRIRETIHEARNPLTIVQNYLGVLNHKLGEEHEARHELELIKDEIDRVGRILLRLRDPDSGQDGGPASLNTLVRQVAEVVDGSLCRTRGIHLHLDLADADPPLPVPADHLRQILINLLKNAAEAQENGGEINVVTLGPTSGNGGCRMLLSVEDKGPGLPPGVQAAAFAPVTTTKGPDHSGLGLSIVKRLTEEIGVGLSFNTGSAGTRFEIRLPCPPPATTSA